jgi:hypothetical protein
MLVGILRLVQVSLTCSDRNTTKEEELDPVVVVEAPTGGGAQPSTQIGAGSEMSIYEEASMI